MREIQKIVCPAAPKALGPYSQAIAAGSFLFISGQLPIVLETGKLCDGEIEAMTHLAIDHLEAILKTAGFSLRDVVKTEVFLKDLNDFPAMNRAYGERFVHDPAPARVTIQAAKLPLDARLEISCIANRIK